MQRLNIYFILEYHTGNAETRPGSLAVGVKSRWGREALEEARL